MSQISLAFEGCSKLEVITAVPGSEAETFAVANNIKFIPIMDTGEYYIFLKVNDKMLYFDQPAIMENNRVLVPFRTIFEALGAEVDWDGETKTVKATRNGLEMVLQINNKEMTVNGETIILDVPPKISTAELWFR